MPELPEVETIVRGLNEKLLHLVLERAEVTGHLMFEEPLAEFCERIAGTQIESVERHGKAIFIGLQKPQNAKKVTLRVHLGMTGQLLWLPKKSLLESHTHLVFHLDHPTHELRYRDIRRFGNLSLLDSSEARTQVPDAWLSTDQEIESSLARINGMLKHALLSQKVLAGLGNIYVDEALHRAKLHPRKTGDRLNPAQRHLLAQSIRVVLGRSIKLGGTSFSNYVDIHGSRGGFKGRLTVYGKTGSPCDVCGTKIKKLVVAGRGTHICPRCQPSPRTA